MTLREAIDHITRAKPEDKRWTDTYIAWLMCDDEGVYAKTSGEETYATTTLRRM
jgi:hypothetical protein